MSKNAIVSVEQIIRSVYLMCSLIYVILDNEKWNCDRVQGPLTAATCSRKYKALYK